jgi:hypothetical protein
MPKLTQDWSAVNVVEDVVVFIGDVREPAIIQKNIMQAFSTFRLRSYPNRGVLVRAGGVVRRLEARRSATRLRSAICVRLASYWTP